jgi:hypothetical protein
VFCRPHLHPSLPLEGQVPFVMASTSACFLREASTRKALATRWAGATCSRAVLPAIGLSCGLTVSGRTPDQDFYPCKGHLIRRGQGLNRVVGLNHRRTRGFAVPWYLLLGKVQLTSASDYPAFMTYGTTRISRTVLGPPDAMRTHRSRLSLFATRTQPSRAVFLGDPVFR